MTVDRIGYLSPEEVAESISPQMANELAGTFQPLDGTLTAYAGLVWTAGKQVAALTAADTLTLLSVGAATANDLIDRQTGDARYAATGSGVTSFNTRTGAVTLTSADVTGALTYTPTSVTGLTGTQSVAAFKSGLSIATGDVSGLGTIATQAANNVSLTGGSFTGLSSSSIGAGSGSPALTVNGGTGTSGPYISFQKGGATVGYVGTDSGINGNNNSHLAFYSAANNILIYASGAVRGTFSSAGLDIVGLLQCDTLRLDATPTAAAVAQTHHVPININGTIYKLLLAS